ncbi:hypothetical protein [Streptomyces sp. NPDC088183]|uniref:hypothetical protein n=1 Tax=Streptomyces sp. NPDC088183 TaxID=3160992 RepID=UPI003442D376
MSDAERTEIRVVKDVLDEFQDRLRHYPDADMGWDEDDIAAFNRLVEKHLAQAVDAGFWWAR